MTPPLPPRHPPTDAEQVVQHLVVVQAERGTPITVGQCEILRQQLEALYAVNYPRHLIASHAGALLRCFAACTTMGAPALNPAPAPAPASAAAAAAVAAQVCDPESFEDAQEQCSMDDSMDGSMDSSSPPPRLRLTDLPNEILGFIYSFVSSDNRRNFFMSCKEIHSCSAIRSQVHRLKLPADAAASDILSFPKDCTLKALKLTCECSVQARLQSLVSLKASNILSSVEELKIIVPECFPTQLSGTTVEGLPHLFPSLSKITFKAQMWLPKLQVILKSLTEGLAPGQLRDLVFQYYNEFSGNVGFCGADLGVIPNPGSLTSLGIALEPACLNPQAAQPIMQLTQLERLYLANANDKEFLEYVPYALQLLAFLPRLNFLQMIKLPTGLVLKMPALETIHFKWLHVQELHELQQCMSGSSIANLRRITLEYLDAGDNPDGFLVGDFRPSPNLLQGCPLDLSATTLILGSSSGKLDVEQARHVVSSLVGLGAPFTGIRQLKMFNRVSDRRDSVPPDIMSDLARLLPGLTSLFLVGYWHNQGMGPCKKAILEFPLLQEICLVTLNRYHKKAHEAFDLIYHKLNYVGRLHPLDLILRHETNPAELVEGDDEALESEDESDLSLSFMDSGFMSEHLSECYES